MSYLSQPTSITDYGLVQIGDNILVNDGIISLAQDIAPTASVSFANVNITGDLSLNNDIVVASITPSNGTGITLSDMDLLGSAVKFKISNSGVLSLIPGTGISLSASTGDITISATGTETINTKLVTENSYTVLATDQYIGVNNTHDVTITLPLGTNGRLYYINDEHGQNAGKINIVGQPGELINGSVKYVASVPYQSVCVVFRGTSWHIL
jgi:hypothetical protein